MYKHACWFVHIGACASHSAAHFRPALALCTKRCSCVGVLGCVHCFWCLMPNQYKSSDYLINFSIAFVCQVRKRHALDVPVRSPFTLNLHHPSTVSPVVTCSAVPASGENRTHWTLLLYRHPITSCVLTAKALPHAVTSYVCITDQCRTRKTHIVIAWEKKRMVLKVKTWLHCRCAVLNLY